MERLDSAVADEVGLRGRDEVGLRGRDEVGMRGRGRVVVMVWVGGGAAAETSCVTIAVLHKRGVRWVQEEMGIP